MLLLLYLLPLDAMTAVVSLVQMQHVLDLWRLGAVGADTAALLHIS